MTTIYEYKIDKLEYTNDDSKGVVVAHWRIEAKDSGKSVDVYGSLNFAPKPDSPDYTPFDQLTEEMVLGWVKGELDTTQIEQALAQKLDKKLNPTIVSGLPWPEDTEEIPE